MADYSYIRMTTPPVAEPLHLTEVKNHLRVSGTTDDTLITNLMTVARQYCENVQGLSYIVRTYEMAFDDGFPTVFYPPYPPLVSVTSIKYTDSDGDTQTVSTSVYTVDDDACPPRIFEAYEQVWPSGLRSIENNVKVVYVAGYVAKITAANATNTFTVYGRTFADADIVRLYNSGGALPAGVSANTDYHVRDVSGSTFKLAATAGGDAVAITDDGTGTNYIQPVDKELPLPIKQAIMLIVGHLYENREETIERRLDTIPLGAQYLLQQERLNW